MRKREEIIVRGDRPLAGAQLLIAVALCTTSSHKRGRGRGSIVAACIVNNAGRSTTNDEWEEPEEKDARGGSLWCKGTRERREEKGGRE